MFNESHFSSLTTASTFQPPLNMFEHTANSDYQDANADEWINPTSTDIDKSKDNPPVYVTINELDNDKPLTPLTSDDNMPELVGDNLGMMGAERSHQPVQALC